MPKKLAISATRRRMVGVSSPRLSSPKASSCQTLSVTVCLSDGLLHEADAARLLALGDIRERAAVEENRALARAVRREHGLELAQQRRFTAA